MNRVKTLLVASVVLALAFTVSCSTGGDENVDDDDGTLSYQGQTYKTVKIGTQTWMAENLNYRGTEPDTLGRCYNDSLANCEKNGRLYNWETAMTVCPSGWHLPSDADWNVLMKFINPSCSDNEDCADAGIKLKATSGWSNGYNGTDNYGFAALPAGQGFFGDRFSNGSGGVWWWSSNSAYSRYVDYYFDDVTFYYNGNIDNSLLQSVRCLKN